MVGHEKCLTEVGKIFQNWIHDPNAENPHPDVRVLVYSYGTEKLINNYYQTEFLGVLNFYLKLQV